MNQRPQRRVSKSETCEPTPRSRGEVSRIGRFAQACLGYPLAVAIVKENAVFVPSPDSVDFEQARALGLKEDSARNAAARNHRLEERGLRGIKVVGFAQFVKYVLL